MKKTLLILLALVAAAVVIDFVFLRKKEKKTAPNAATTNLARAQNFVDAVENAEAANAAAAAASARARAAGATDTDASLAGKAAHDALLATLSKQPSRTQSGPKESPRDRIANAKGI